MSIDKDIEAATRLKELLCDQLEDIVGYFTPSCDKEKLILALLAIEVACIYERITAADALQLKDQLRNHIPFEPIILNKLTIGERSSIVDYSKSSKASTIEVKSSVETSSPKASVHNDNNFIGTEDQPLQCYVCNDFSSVKSGVFCNDELHSDCHFQCSECLTNWTEVLNQQRKENSTALQRRHGLIKCSVEGCVSPPYSRATICQHITRSDVLEGFLDNLQYCESLSLYAEYQEKLQAATQELKDAIISEENGTKQCDSTKGMNNPAIEKLNIVVKRQELESLTGTFMKQFPDARMCPNCSFGPMINRACDNLLSHHNQVIKTINSDEGVEITVQIDNRCPQCTFLSETWSDYPTWDGTLPEVIRGNAFCLGSSVNENNDTIVPVKVLTPAEAREQRILALEKAAEETKKLKEAAIELKSSTTHKCIPMKSKLEIEAEERSAKEAAAKKLHLEKLKAKEDRLLTLKRIKADRDHL